MKEDEEVKPYSKIKTVWKRDPNTKYKTLIPGQWALPEFEYLQMTAWSCYEKIDGTNIRAIYWPLTDTVEFRGRSDKAQIPPFLLAVLEEKITSDMKYAFDLSKSGDTPITLYGEGFGRRIQKRGELYGEPDFCLFDIRIGDYWMDQDFVTEVAEILELQRAPIMCVDDLHEAINHIRKHQWKSHWGDFLVEGFILRPNVDLYTRQGDRIISKIKHKDFPIPEDLVER